MKILIAGLAIVASLPVSALTGEQLLDSGKQALALAVFEIDAETIEAFQAVNGTDEAEVEILFHDEDHGGEDILAYGCHLHGADVACHEEGDLDHKALVFNDFYAGFEASSHGFKQVVANFGSTLDDLVAVKGWKLEDHDHKNANDGEVWFRYDFTNVDQMQTVYSMCHYHGGGANLDCHFTFDGEDEPQF